MSNYQLDSNTNMINKNFEKIAALLPFSYGGRQYIIQGDNTKKKNKRKNLRLALKSGYTWDTHRPLTFAEYREQNNYTDEYCAAQDMKINEDVFPIYQKYRNKYFYKYNAVNTKFADVQSYNLISNLLDEIEILKKKSKYSPPSTEDQNTEWDGFGSIGCI